LGLGLSLVKQLVELHGGQISAASAGAGRGATFTVRFPLRAVYVKEENGRRSAGQELAPAPPISPQALAGARLLVLDDEADARLVLTSLFQGYGAEVRAVTSGVEALALLTGGAWQPEVLICDIGLPEEDGYAFMRHVRALPPEQGGKLPAIALTAYNRYPDRLQSLQAGYQMHLAKPVEPLELAVTVASLLGRQWHTVELGR
jgi:CheY-like chemotaxis protein